MRDAVCLVEWYDGAAVTPAARRTVSSWANGLEVGGTRGSSKCRRLNVVETDTKRAGSWAIFVQSPGRCTWRRLLPTPHLCGFRPPRPYNYVSWCVAQGKGAVHRLRADHGAALRAEATAAGGEGGRGVGLGGGALHARGTRRGRGGEAPARRPTATVPRVAVAAAAAAAGDQSAGSSGGAAAAPGHLLGPPLAANGAPEGSVEGAGRGKADQVPGLEGLRPLLPAEEHGKAEESRAAEGGGREVGGGGSARSKKCADAVGDIASGSGGSGSEIPDGVSLSLADCVSGLSGDIERLLGIPPPRRYTAFFLGALSRAPPAAPTKCTRR